MHFRFCRARIWLVAALVVASRLTAVAGEAPVSFNRDIRPILSDQCFFCHGPDPSHRAADLRLDVEDQAKDYVIVAGQPQLSELINRITSDDSSERMPPVDSGKSLNSDQIELLERWITQGAPYEPYWAYAPPRRHDPPAVSDSAWPRTWIDRFLVARMESEGLKPSQDADRVTLIRRLNFDLTGLPPTPTEVADFVADHQPGAYERLVDRLLASQRFGERMAMYWLDLVRYADTVGYHGDQDHSISPYRDYVIDAFNRNLPFNQFTLEQLAGDLIPEATIDQRVATGYNRLLQTSHEGGVQPKEYLAIYAADRVRNLSSVWLSGTMGCAQCHDHKYDPYTTRDFYSLAAFFADVDEAKHFKLGSNALPTARPPELEVLNRQDRKRLADLEMELAECERLAATSGDQNDERSLAERVESLKEQIESIRKRTRKTMITVAIEPRTMRMLPRGDWLDDSGDIVGPAIPAFLGSLDVGQRRANRADLARWLTDTELGIGGLTARVMANRFWYLLLGTGIANTLDDFGGQGEPPVHPELLDTLAVEFYESGWDVKHMMKLIVMSRVYQQSSRDTSEARDKDPANRLYARQSRFRLPAEMVRDNALAISGLLVEEIGGASVRPYQPASYYRHLNFPTRRYQHHADQRQWRRGVYMHWQRQFLHPMLKAFDAPSREECTAQRARSNTPLAALTLLNDPSFVEAAHALAARALRENSGNDRQRIAYTFHLAVSRDPDEFELQQLEELLLENRRRYEKDSDAAQQLLSVGLAEVDSELEPTELAAWTNVARAVLNLNETITRN
jgi:hypothetical protein